MGRVNTTRGKAVGIAISAEKLTAVNQILNAGRSFYSVLQLEDNHYYIKILCLEFDENSPHGIINNTSNNYQNLKK